jgi:DNA invertase Pin-like site-specific DNA recombinase
MGDRRQRTGGRRRVVGYLRVSTNGQAEHGLGLDVQADSVRQYCKAQQHRLVALLTDEGESGGDGLETRLKLATALRMLRDGEADVLVVPRLDRLARDVILQETLLREVWSMGREVESCVSAETDLLVDDDADPSRKLIRTILGAVNEYEKGMIKLRLRGGRRRKIAEGGFGGGIPPLGKTPRDGELVNDETETETIARIAELHGQGLSLRQIARVLTTEGRHTKRGGRWAPETINRVIRRL